MGLLDLTVSVSGGVDVDPLANRFRVEAANAAPGPKGDDYPEGLGFIGFQVMV